MRAIITEAGSASAAGSVSDDEARAELADEPYKLELIGIKGSAGRPPRRRASRSAPAS